MAEPWKFCEIEMVKKLFREAFDQDVYYRPEDFIEVLDKLEPIDVIPQALHDKVVRLEIRKRMEWETRARQLERKVNAIVAALGDTK